MATSETKMADTGDRIFIGKGEQPAWLTLALANRHGLVTGATGTGKTVYAAGDGRRICARGRSGIRRRHQGRPVRHRRSRRGQGLHRQARQGRWASTFQPDEFSTVFWDVFGEQGHPVRATISEMGPLLLSRMMDLNDVQEGVLNIAFRVADEQGLLLLDMKDLRAARCDRSRSGKKAAMPTKLRRRKRRSTATSPRPRSAPSSASFWCWRTRAATKFFGEPALALKDFMRTDSDGRGMVNILVADKLMQSPRLYATFLLWMLSELFEQLPEVGDLPKPKLVFFFDEAHLLFNDAPKALMDKIEQVVRLIRSKGVGVYFVTQNPIDVPDKVLAQLGNRVQHALRAFTPRDQKAVAAAAQTFRPNPKLDTAQVITELGKGEALVSFLEGNGTPAMVERVMIRPPTGRIGPITPEERKAIIGQEPGEGQIRHRDRCRIGLRDAAEARGRHGRAAPARAVGGRRRRRRHSRSDRRDRRQIFGTNVARGRTVDRPGHRAQTSPARSPTRWPAGSPPISASRSAARWAVRSAARWCAARSAGLLRR